MWTVISAVLSAAMLLLMLADFVYRHVIPEAEHRERFHSWLRTWLSRAGTVASVIRRKLLLAAGLAGACVVVWASVSGIVAFAASDGPVSRPEVLRLLLNAFNVLAYGVTGLFLAVLLLPERKAPADAEHKGSGRLVLGRKEGESIFLTVAPGADAGALFQKLVEHGITVEIEEASRNYVRVGIVAPSEIRIKRTELDAR